MRAQLAYDENDKRRLKRRNSILTGIFAVLAVVSRVASYVATPLWEDSLYRQTHSNTTNNLTQANVTEIIRLVDPYFVVIWRGIWGIITFGIPLIIVYIWYPRLLSDADRNFPKRQFIHTGGVMAISSLLFSYGASGTRTAPYLQALLGNFKIPITFITRYVRQR